MVSALLRTALERRRLRTTLTQISSETGINTGSLSRFQHGERKGLRSESIDRLGRYLGVKLNAASVSLSEDRDLTGTLRAVLDEFSGSLRQVAHYTGIDAGNLSRFLRGERSGMSMESIDRLSRYFKLEATWCGTLSVDVWYRPKGTVWERAACPGVPIACALRKHGHFFDRTETDSKGRAFFGEVTVGAIVYVYVDDVLIDAVEMMEDYQEFTIRASRNYRPWV